MTKPFARVVAALALLVALAALTTPGSAQSLAFIPTASAIIDGLAYGGGLGPMVAADFDADGDDDLLLGAPGDDGGALYGLRGPVFSDGDAPALRDAPVLHRGVAGQGFAAALAAGDIDGDGIADALIWSAAGPRRLDVRFGGPAFFDPGRPPSRPRPTSGWVHASPCARCRSPTWTATATTTSSPARPMAPTAVPDSAAGSTASRFASARSRPARGRRECCGPRPAPNSGSRARRRSATPSWPPTSRATASPISSSPSTTTTTTRC